MNSYGDAQNYPGGRGGNGSPQGRAQIPVPPASPPDGAPPGGSPGWAANAGANSGGYGAGGTPGGRASVPFGGAAPAGGAPGGRASVPGASRHGTPGRASVGSASVGSASVGSASVGAASVGSASVGSAAAGSASVGAGPVGRASVGRAGVGPVGRPGPGGFGRGSRANLSPEALAARRKKARRRNVLIGGFAVLIILAGGLVVGGTYYYSNVPAPQELELPEASTILYSNGTQLAKLGEENGGNREYVKIDAIPKWVQDAVISAEDRNFYEHGGVDVKGIMRAAWNNISGGDTQGASTITQQYARKAADLSSMSYARKIREAVIASKLNSEYTKPQILEFYLNIIYLGRGAYGIQAASRAYFGKTVDKLTPAEAAVLAALIKQPEQSATHKGYDPAVNPEAAKDRWTYVIDGMVKMGTISEADKAKLQYPKVLAPSTNSCVSEATCGVDTPVGNVVNYVNAELKAKGITDLRKGGYRITTSIDAKMQKAAENAARHVKGSPMYGQKNNLMAALVGIDPKTGRVLAYYGGERGTDWDYAGTNTNKTTGALEGGHTPGSTFKIYTLAAALKDNISMDSHWDPLITEDPDTHRKLTNAGRDDSGSIPCGNYCTLEKSTIESYNVPFYFIAKQIGQAKIVDAARLAGIRTMWADTYDSKGNSTGKMQVLDLTKMSAAQAGPKYGSEIGFGQTQVTVLDHANGLATFAADGVYHKAHFVVKVEQKGSDGKYKVIDSVNEKGEQRFSPDQVSDLDAALQQIPAAHNDELKGDRPALGKTGTWQLGDTKENGDAWMIGATPQLATAVWIGTTGKREALRDKNNVKIQGATLPAEVWKKFMNDALSGKKVEKFQPAAHTGDANAGNGKKPPEQPTNPACQLSPNPDLCELFGNNGGGNNGGGGDHNGGGNNGRTPAGGGDQNGGATLFPQTGGGG